MGIPDDADINEFIEDMGALCCEKCGGEHGTKEHPVPNN